MLQLFLKLCSMSVTAGYVILAVFMLRFALKKVPKVFSYSLWGVVLFRLVCPFSFESLFSLLPSADPLPQKILLSAVPAPDTGIPPVDALFTLPAPAPGNSASPMQVLAAAGAAIWLTGLLALLCFSLVSLLKLHSRLQHAVWLYDNVYQCAEIETPFVMGCFRPRIYLPYGLEGTRREYVLLHERTHIRRGDIWIKPFAFLVLCIHWFNPLVWLAFIYMNKDMELSCDERVLKRLGAGAKADYSALLLSFSAPKFRIAGSPLAFGENGAKTRIKNALHYKKPAFWVIALAVLVLAAAVILLVSNPKTTNEATPILEETGSAAKIPEEPSGASAVQEISAPSPEEFLREICSGISVETSAWSNRNSTAKLVMPAQMPDGYEPSQLFIHVSGTAQMGDGAMTVHVFEQLSENFGFEPGKTYSEEIAGKQELNLELEASLLEKDGTVRYTTSAAWVQNMTMAQGETITAEGVPVLVKLMMTQGRYLAGEAIAPDGGLGASNYVGECALEAWVSNASGEWQKQLNAPYALDGGALTFCVSQESVPFLLELEDYNDDGAPEFALGQWGSSSVNVYSLFTMNAAGQFLPASDAYAVSSSDGKGSAKEYSPRFEKVDGGFRVKIYNNATGDFISQIYRWDTGRQQFVLAEDT